MTDALVDTKFQNFVAFIKEAGTNTAQYKEYENKALLTDMVIKYVKPAKALGQLDTIGTSMCGMLGITNCCHQKKLVRYLEFFCDAL